METIYRVNGKLYNSKEEALEAEAELKKKDNEKALALKEVEAAKEAYNNLYSELDKLYGETAKALTAYEKAKAEYDKKYSEKKKTKTVYYDDFSDYINDLINRLRE